MMKRDGLVYGVGVNDSETPVYATERINGRKKNIWSCTIYQSWVSMLSRCYSEKYQARWPTYAGCTVAHEWHSFSTFRAWAADQDHEGKQLDKDILLPGNKVYGPDTCVFVPRDLNSFMSDSCAARGEWPIGVCWDDVSKKFKARCHNPFTKSQGYIGLFTGQAEAHEAWRARKHEHACRYADQQTDPRIAQALRTRYAKKPEGETA